MSAIAVRARKSIPRSPLRYPGGKAALAGFLDELMARRGLDTYVEPYAGGAGAAIELLLGNAISRIWINDLDPAIYAFWISITQHSDEFLDKLSKVPLTLEEWRIQQGIYRYKDAADPVSLGFSTFYLNRTNRSGVMNAGVIGGQAQSGRYRIDARFDRLQLAQRIAAIAKQSNRITVTNVDGADIIRRASRIKASLIYADPPYYAKGSFLYLNSFEDQQHTRLAGFLNRRQNANWVLTYDDHPRIRELYTSRASLNYRLQYSAHRPTQVDELMIVSDALRTSIAFPQAD